MLFLDISGLWLISRVSFPFFWLYIHPVTIDVIIIIICLFARQFDRDLGIADKTPYHKYIDSKGIKKCTHLAWRHRYQVHIFIYLNPEEIPINVITHSVHTINFHIKHSASSKVISKTMLVTKINITQDNRSWQHFQSADGEGFTRQSDRTSQSTLDTRSGTSTVRFPNQISVFLACGRGSSFYLVSRETPDTMARLPLSIQAIESSCCVTVPDNKKRKA